MTADLDVVGVGNALVDVISMESDEFIEGRGLVKGSMRLIEPDEAVALYDAMGPGVEMSGGSAANTLAGLASLGGRGGFIGRVRDDQLGTVFAHDIRSVGIEFPVPPATTGSPTGRSLIIVSSDAERTMNTLLGAAAELGPDDVDAAFVARAQVTYLEGYLFDRELAGQAFEKAAAAAHNAGRLVALTLSDSFCVERFLTAFRGLVSDVVDILFGNEDELCLLYETDDAMEALGHAERVCDLVVMTRSADGSVVSKRGQRLEVAAEPVPRVVDTTGAGDLYAAGFLYGLTHGHDLATSARLGSIAAAEVISHVGARPETVLAGLAAPLLV
ncbi:MAG TPA: adenosine kinase [Acidimicrobiales bacterium]|nr:adenosine kinase [Acidimicrobiales bacterium]